MQKTAVAVLCILIPFQAQGQQAATPSNPPTSEKPNLIELTSANWKPLSSKQKFEVFARDLFYWETHASLLLQAGISTGQSDRSYLGVGAAGYFSRYGLNVADEVDFVFFNAFLFPTLFHQDPRYIPLDQGSMSERLRYALTRVLVARSDSGKLRFNESRLLGNLLATSVSSAYYSSFGADESVKGTFVSFGINVGSEAAFDVLKEFWPDAARKLKLNVWIRNMVRRAIRDSIRVS